MKMVETQMLFVDNIPRVSIPRLRKMFCKYGTILKAGIGNRADTQGIGFIVYEKVSEAVEAYNAMNNVTYENKYIKIRFYQPFNLGNRSL
ncbi:pre-mRNA branch site P14-like protein [Vairimorpha necatrix]|uniref:Pre-mRNA branch site P14-like protein n=1 Tax=Vairimorpha necatrix TaxID=6039 RepID=A0AAX4JD29_9MICR